MSEFSFNSNLQVAYFVVIKALWASTGQWFSEKLNLQKIFNKAGKTEAWRNISFYSIYLDYSC